MGFTLYSMHIACKPKRAYGSEARQKQLPPKHEQSVSNRTAQFGYMTAAGTGCTVSVRFTATAS